MKPYLPLLAIFIVAGTVGCKDDDSNGGTTSPNNTTNNVTNAATSNATANNTIATNNDTTGESNNGSNNNTNNGTIAQSALDLAVAAVGGEDALTGLRVLRIEASGSRSIDYEGMEPTELVDASTYTTTYLLDLENDALRLETTRTALFEAFQFFPPEEYGVVLNGDVGGLTVQTGFYPPGAMPSQHVGALRQQQRLFNPHVYLRAALSDPSVATEEADAMYDGRPHHVVSIAEDPAPRRLFIDAETGLISKLETMENSPLWRDVAIEVRYGDWQAQGELFFPMSVELHAAEGLVQDESRTAFAVNPTDVAADAFDLPPDAGAPADPESLAFGHDSHQVVEAFFQILFGYDFGGATQPNELAPGVVLLAAGHNSIGVLVDGSVVVVEAPISPRHGDHLVDTLGTQFPGASISHVIQSHHHQDHSAGVRSLAAAGATVVVGAGVGAFFEGVLAAPSTLRPDALSLAPVATQVDEVDEDGTFVVSDASITVTAYHVSANPHAEDMLITLVDTGTQRFVYVADLYNAGAGFTVVNGGPESFMGALRDLNIIDAACASAIPLTIVPAHGVPQSLADSIAELSGLGIDVGCP